MTATLTVGELQARVDLGIAYLDRTDPGWWKVDQPGRGKDGGPIDLARLSMADPCGCVIGHRYGSYYRAEITIDDGVAMGFDSATAYQVTEETRAEWERRRDDEFDALTQLWTRVIEQRRAGVDQP